VLPEMCFDWTMGRNDIGVFVMTDRHWYEQQIEEGVMIEVERFNEDVGTVYYKQKESIPISNEELEDAIESTHRLKDRLDYYGRAKNNLE
jgi:hypothetical protein